jgi:hypothetical protein
LQKALIKKAGFESQISELKEFAAKEKLEIVQLPTCLPTSRQVGRQVRKGRFSARGGQVREGGLEVIPPALQILGEISSNFFERTPPVGKCEILLHYSPAFTPWLTVSKDCQRT